MTPISAHDIARELRSRLRFAGDVKIHKLLYYCQGWHLVATGEPLFSENIEAWTNGPVVADLWRTEKHGDAVPPPLDLSQSGQETVSHVLSQYGHLNGVDLIRLTHSERPWKEVSEQDSWEKRIPQSLLIEHFEKDAAARRYVELRSYADGHFASQGHDAWLSTVRADIAAGGQMPAFGLDELSDLFTLEA